METKELTPQQTRVLEYLQSGKTLTNKVALTCLDVGSLSSRIAELRKLGYTIHAHMKSDHADRSYKAYSMSVPPKG